MAAAFLARNRTVLMITGGGLLVLFLLARRGAAAEAAAMAGAAVVNAAGGAVSGAVGAVSEAVGLPTPGQTTTDAAVARWIIDHHGYLTASMWAGAPALFGAMGMPAGSGTPPPQGTPAALALVVLPTTGDFARLDRAAPVVDLGDPWRIGAPGWDGLPMP